MEKIEKELEDGKQEGQKRQQNFITTIENLKI